MSYRIAADVGGTFTDIVAVDDRGRVTFAKSASTPEDQSIGVMDGLDSLAKTLSLSLEDLLAETDRVVHGMTVATNALLERKGAKVGLLTTAGHRDVLEMREGLKPDRYNLRLPRAEPLVPRHLRLGVVERMRANGSVQKTLSVDQLKGVIRKLKRAKVTSVAVCYLHAYKDNSHEVLTKEILAVEMPDVYVCLSSEVLPQIKEYQRVSTTVVNAYVGPLIRGYLEGLESRLTAVGFKGPLLVMLSHGGVAPVGEAVRIAAATVLSGPAGGLAAAKRVSQILEIPNLIPFDMGGTSSDISLIVDGAVSLSAERQVNNEKIALPSLDIITLGAGGGSIGRVEGGGLLKVGPQSAGAKPGPACYGFGGSAATVTDASVVLGYLDPDKFSGGGRYLDRQAAAKVVGDLGRDLDIDLLSAAEGVHRVVNTLMVEGIRLATVKKGVDPRRFSLLGFGGAAGLHVTQLARMLSVTRVVVPRVASVLSAWGMLATELRSEAVHSHIGDTSALNVEDVRQLYRRMRDDGRSRMSDWFDGRIESLLSAEMRYGEQIYEIDVPMDHIDIDSPSLLDELKSAFEKQHERLYTYSLKDQKPILVNARVATIGQLPIPPEEPMVITNEATPVARRSIYLGCWIDVDVYDFDELGPGQVIDGPAIVESHSTSVLLRDGDRSVTTPGRWLDIAVSK